MIDPKFVINLRGKDFPTWPGVLDAATKAGLKSLTTTVIQVPAPENGHLAVVLARAEFADGRIFEDVGDCSPESTSPQLAPAALRMASTRAKGRCLRDALSIGATMFEELAPDLGAEEEDSEPPAGLRLPARNGAAPACEGCGRPLTKGQRDVSERSYGRPLCPTCQKGATRRPLRAG
jgi:hypothetical protein